MCRDFMIDTKRIYSNYITGVKWFILPRQDWNVGFIKSVRMVDLVVFLIVGVIAFILLSSRTYLLVMENNSYVSVVFLRLILLPASLACSMARILYYDLSCADIFKVFVYSETLIYYLSWVPLLRIPVVVVSAIYAINLLRGLSGYKSLTKHAIIVAFPAIVCAVLFPLH